MDRPNALILDTETTGLDGDAEVVELAVIDCAGSVPLDILVRPIGPIPVEAAAIHGITDAMLADTLTWSKNHDGGVSENGK
jgi:DNA polymerase-3 subunit epsilon